MSFDGLFEGEIAGEKKFYGRESEEEKLSKSGLEVGHNVHNLPASLFGKQILVRLSKKHFDIPGSTIGTNPACCEIEAYLA